MPILIPSSLSRPVKVELLSQLGQCLLTLDCGQGHLRLERR